jgi:hypothetical protein
MAKKINKQNLKSNDSSYEERLMVLVENLGDQVKLVAEGNLMLRQTMEGRFDVLEGRFDSLEGRFDSLEGRFDVLEGRFDSLEGDMHSSFKMIIEYLSRIEDEIAEIKIDFKRLEENKADKETLISFEKRIAKVERELEEYKNLCKSKK